MTPSRYSDEALVAVAGSGSLDDVLDTLLGTWDSDVLAGRERLLARLRALRRDRGPEALRGTAEVIYRSLITFGEESGDMFFVHLAVQCRDALIYGL